MSTTLIQSHVRHGDKWFFVSTINRESSAMHGYGHIYAETLVWDFDFQTKERGAIVTMGEGPADSIRTHLRICEQLHSKGSAE